MGGSTSSTNILCIFNKNCFFFLFFFYFYVFSDPLVWPKPQYYEYGNNSISINPEEFKIIIPQENEILQNIISRYNTLLFPFYINNDYKELPILDMLEINIDSLDDTLSIDTDVSYEIIIQINNDRFISIINANNCYGALYALETFSQLIQVIPNNNDNNINYQYNILNVPLIIRDYPKYKWRGLLIDTSRHYASINKLENILDTMVSTKLNIFHWHITDAESFPFQSRLFPNLIKGAYNPSLIYTYDDINHIIQYAKNRGIIVIPEIDMPGHVYSWNKGYPGVALSCQVGEGNAGLLDPANPETYTIVEGLLSELFTLFPYYTHIGADEVKFHCWTDNKTYVESVTNFWQSQGISPTDTNSIACYFYNHTFNHLQSYSRKFIAWEELLMIPGLVIPQDTIIQSWRNWGQSGFRKALDNGYKVILSNNWYLSEIVHSDRHWDHYYFVNDKDLAYGDNFNDKMLGGESCLWGELVDDTERELFIWPNAAAIAERLWTLTPQFEDAEDRLSSWICYIQRRNLQSSTINSKYCFNTQDINISENNIITNDNHIQSNSTITNNITSSHINILAIIIIFIGFIIGYRCKISLKQTKVKKNLV